MSSNNENSSFDFNGLKRVLQIGAQSKFLFWSVVFIAVFSACFSVYRPYLTGNIIDDYIQTKDLPGLKYQIIKLALPSFAMTTIQNRSFEISPPKHLQQTFIDLLSSNKQGRHQLQPSCLLRLQPVKLYHPKELQFRFPSSLLQE